MAIKGSLVTFENFFYQGLFSILYNSSFNWHLYLASSDFTLPPLLSENRYVFLFNSCCQSHLSSSPLPFNLQVIHLFTGYLCLPLTALGGWSTFSTCYICSFALYIINKARISKSAFLSPSWNDIYIKRDYKKWRILKNCSDPREGGCCLWPEAH